MSALDWRVVLGGGLVAAALIGGARVASGAPGVPGSMTPSEVHALAKQITARHLPLIDPCMVTALAGIESSYRPGAVRPEPHIGDASAGLLQTLYGTAKWLRFDMGYRDYELASADDLLQPQVSIYFGAAYLDYLRRRDASAEYMIRAYNGGPGGWTGDGPANHWRKHQAELARLHGAGVC